MCSTPAILNSEAEFEEAAAMAAAEAEEEEGGVPRTSG